ncbi:MAG: FecR domain-containing protein [Verrucomicrobia bacterium]|nr:FecR domain-containing protein [Verrucomicrobiota bacterium]
MKYVGSFTRMMVPVGVALVAAVLAGSVQAQTQQGQAQVRGIKGSADYSDGGGAWMPLTVNKVLKQGSTIRTAGESEVDLYLAKNGPSARVLQNSTLGLDKLLFERTGADVVIETRLDLKAGRVQGKVDKTAAASIYQVKTPRAVAAIHGTLYDISADGMVVVKEGTVNVDYLRGAETLKFVVNEKQTFDPSIPGVRAATQPELNIPPFTPGLGTPTLVFEPGKEPYVSPTNAKGTGTSNP